MPPYKYTLKMILPTVFIVVPFFGLTSFILRNPPQKGTTMETIGRTPAQSVRSSGPHPRNRTTLPIRPKPVPQRPTVAVRTVEEGYLRV